jgi:surfeit locus 1 family protein
MMPRGKDWIFVALAVAFAAVCARLGVWQLDRLGQRKARNAQVSAGLVREPLEIGEATVADRARNRLVHAAGVFDYAHERVWRARSFDGVPGVAVLTPLRLRDGSAVFVDRGWAPSPDGVHVDLARYRGRDTVDLVALAAVAPRGRGDVDPARLRDSLPYAIRPLVLQLLPARAPEGPGLQRWPLPAITNGPHLGYAIQWFSFAVIALVGTAVLLRTERRKGRRMEG